MNQKDEEQKMNKEFLNETLRYYRHTRCEDCIFFLQSLGLLTAREGKKIMSRLESKEQEYVKFLEEKDRNSWPE